MDNQPAYKPTCPICKAALPENGSGRPRPFCSSRCQLVDLGNWLGERYAVPVDEPDSGAPAKKDQLEDEAV